MLARSARLHRSADFAEVVRRGRRSSRSTLTVHLLLPAAAPSEAAAQPRAGLVVSKAVGGSVVRSRVSRRLRHLLPGRLVDLPDGSRLVVRAAPAAATASSGLLAADLDTALQRVRQSRSGASSGRSVPARQGGPGHQSTPSGSTPSGSTPSGSTPSGSTPSGSTP